MNKIIILLFIIIGSCVILYCTRKKNIIVPDVKWPFLNLKDENNKNINVLVIRAFLDTPELKKQFLQYYHSGISFIGCSSYLSYPKNCLNNHGRCHNIDVRIDNKYIEEYVLGWCHCFRNPEDYIKFSIPRILLSESDFPNYDFLRPDNTDILYDFICIQPIDTKKCEAKWHAHNKNWKLAEKCIKIFVDEFHLRGIVIGREHCPIDVIHRNRVTTTGFLKYSDCITKMKQSRFMLLPNFEDASPRVLTEALSLNKPVFVYEKILGGWKYVNPRTGIFFNETNINKQVKYLLENLSSFSPRKAFLEEYCIEKQGKRFKKFLQSIYPDLSPCKYVKFAVS